MRIYVRPKRIPPRARHVSGQMNKLEQRYAAHLEKLKIAGDIIEYRFERIKLKLADKTYYTADFVVLTSDEIQIHEVKGFWEDDARVKIKVAADMFWEFRFIAIQEKNKQWVYERFN